MTETLRWGILGPGSIARRFASQLTSSATGRLAAVGSSERERARAFVASTGSGPGVRAGGYDDVLGADDVDAVYVATVHTGHAALAVAAMSAGRHVLCEKPLAPNLGTVMTMVDVARSRGMSLVEAYMYRFHPQTRKVLELVRDGAIGEVLHIEASFSFSVGHPAGRLFDPEVAGGGILDVGGYPVSYARAIAGAAADRSFAEPVEVRAVGSIGEAGVDEWSVARLTFPGGPTAVLRTGVRLADPAQVTILGSRGTITLSDPWTLTSDPRLVLRVVGREPEEIVGGEALPYALEADALATSVGVGEAPEMTLDDSLGNARVLDAWRAAIGLRYPFEADDAPIPTVGGRRLRVTGSPMPRGNLPGLAKPVSRLVLGCDNQPNLSYASAMFDHFFAAGGNAFDTGYIYGGGLQERLLGQWIANRGVRDDVVVITKGAHTPHCDPDSLSRQLLESLERQQADHADIYLMHRDNPQVGVDEFVDVLNSHVSAGRIGIFGGSNWTAARVDEANKYAAARGLDGFAAVSNHFGLARAHDVPWDGCVHATDPDSRRWLVERQIPLLPWSSQARGFFTGRARREDRSDSELVRCYYSDDNFERLRRAEELAAELGVPATAVALAYVLHQPFPTFPLFGPRTIAECRSSMKGLTIALSAERVAWLDLATEDGSG